MMHSLHRWTDTTKHCSSCKQWLPYSSFGKHRSQPLGLAGICKQCMLKYRDDNIRRRRELHRKVNYGLLPGEYAAMELKQNNKCASCGLPAPGKHKLGVDHNHRTGKVRALLCVHCNTIVGHCQED